MTSSSPFIRLQLFTPVYTISRFEDILGDIGRTAMSVKGR